MSTNNAITATFRYFTLDNMLPVGGRLKPFNSNWKRITSNRSILQTVHGYRIDFFGKSEPVQLREPQPYKLMPEEIKAVDDGVIRLFKENVTEVTNEEAGQFISNNFTRPKSNGRYRMILDLSELNECIESF